MIITHTQKSAQNEFVDLLTSAQDSVTSYSKTISGFAESFAGTKLEDLLYEKLTKLAVGTRFNNTIEKISGHHFPDIIAKYDAERFFGVEVKTTIKNHWKTVGNSILESSRKANIDNIYLFFGKLGDPVEFRFRLYQDCLHDVAVTHHPRYQIDMNLEEGKTIFNKMGLDYNALRNSENPVRQFSNYYKKLLKPGEEIWWLDSDSKLEENVSATIRVFNQVEKTERYQLLAIGFVLFPEVFRSNSCKYKFNGFSTWLIKNHSIICSNVRDYFSAGGIKVIDGVKVPKIIYNWKALNKEILAYLVATGIEPEAYCGTINEQLNNRINGVTTKWLLKHLLSAI
jgi:hypothetical protein